MVPSQSDLLTFVILDRRSDLGKPAPHNVFKRGHLWHAQNLAPRQADLRYRADQRLPRKPEIVLTEPSQAAE
jgi:hypothetical protein